MAWQAFEISRQFIYLDSNISSTESDIRICIGKIFTTTDTPSYIEI